MELNAFIQSGLLESYVLGQCAPAESALVERMLAQHPEVRAEMDKIEQTLETVAQAYAVAPPPGLKERILADINRPTTPEAVADTAVPPSAARMLPLAVGVFLLATGWLFFQNNNLRQQNNTQALELAARTQELADCNAKTGQKEKIYALQGNPRTKDFKIEGENITIPVYLNEDRCEVAFNLSKLGSPGEGKYYQLWAIVGKTPKSVGMVHAKIIDGWVTTSCVPGAAAYAISVEVGPEEKDGPTMPTVKMKEVPAG